MRKISTILSMAGSIGILGLAPFTGAAQQTRAQAIAGLRKVSPSEMDPSYTKPAPYAQELVDRALARHPEVLLLAIHATPPHHGNVIVASNFDRIGKRGDEDDMRCIRTGKPNLEVNGPHFEDELALKDASGQTIGAIGVVFNYRPGEDKAPLIRTADDIEHEMSRAIRASTSLFEPAK
ncbi:MAG TPA: hypothetical protein VGS10_22650 [Terracidiphilus sp.]|nr:hypothetical protein [Terracidiphilus sp.]